MSNLPEHEQSSCPPATDSESFLQALFLCEDTTVQSVSTLCGLDRETNELYEGAFWNCLDRKQDRPYLAYLCGLEQAPFTRGDFAQPEEPGPNLRQVAFKTGRTDLVLVIAGLSSTNPQTTMVEHYREIEAAYLDSALLGILASKFTAAENPALAAALRIIAKEKEQHEERPEPWPNPAEAITLVVNAMEKYRPPEEPPIPYEI